MVAKEAKEAPCDHVWEHVDYDRQRAEISSFDIRPEWEVVRCAKCRLHTRLPVVWAVQE